MNSVKKSDIEAIMDIFRIIDRLRSNNTEHLTPSNRAYGGKVDTLLLYSALLIILNGLISSKNSTARPLKDNRVPHLLDKVSKIYEILMS